MLETTIYTLLIIGYIVGAVLTYCGLFLGPSPYGPRWRAWLFVVAWLPAGVIGWAVDWWRSRK